MVIWILLGGIGLGLTVIVIRPDGAGVRIIALVAAVLAVAVGLLVRPHPTTPRAGGWALPANAAIMPALTAQGQEMVLNAAMYPIAVISIKNATDIARLNAVYAQPSREPRHIGFLAVVDPHPASNAQALAAARRVMQQHHITLPWAVIIDPPSVYETSTVQLYLPGTHGIRHVTGSALWSDWARVLAPIAIHHATTSAPHSSQSQGTPSHGNTKGGAVHG